MDDTKSKGPRQTRCRYIVGGTIIIAIVVAVAATLGLVYGLRSGDDKSLKLRVISVQSYGLVNDTAMVTVEYEAAQDHTVDWRISRYTGVLSQHAGGQVIATMKNGVKVFHSIYAIPVKNFKFANIAIYSNIESIYMQFNLTTLFSAWTYTLPKWKNNFVRINPRVKAPSVGDLNLTMAVDIDASKPPEPEAFIDALNTSTDPPTVFEIHSFYSTSTGPLTVSLKSISIATHLIISLKHELIQYGGILTALLPEVTDTTFIIGFSHGLSVEIDSPIDNDVIPRGACGLYDRKKIPFYENTQQVICFAMGNPMTEIKVLKESSENKLDVMKSETILTEKWMCIEVVTLHDRETQTGNYTCRAICENQVVDVPIEVFAAEAVQFIANETGVLENTTSKIVVQCSATGVPVPDLTFTLYHKYGPDMILSGKYKYERNKTDTTASLTMTISPNTWINQVTCVGSQLHTIRTWDATIVLFPDGVRN